MSKKLKIVFFAWGLAVSGTFAGFTLTYFFPQLEQAFVKAQLAFRSDRPAITRLVIIAPPSARNRGCPEGRWHPEDFETLLMAMKRSGVSVVTSFEDFSHLPGSGCGDLGSLARLAETTKRAGHVLYPDSASAMLRQAASGVGFVHLSSEEDRPLDFTPASPVDSETIFPLGLATANVVMNRERVPASIPDTGRGLIFSGSFLPDFPVQSFETVNGLWEAGDVDGLKKFLHEKIVLVAGGDFPDTTFSGGSETPSTILSVHARMIHSALTRDWLSEVPIGVAMGVSMLMAWIMAFFLLQPRQTQLFMWSGIAGFLVSLLAGGLLPRVGWLWPMAGTLMSIGFTASGSVIWKACHTQADLQARIHEGQERLMHLKDELARKQHYVRELEEKLEDVRTEARQSVSVISGLQDSQDTVFRQLQESEEAVTITRQQISRLQNELVALRQQLPASLTSRSEDSSAPDYSGIRQECAALNILTRDPGVLELFSRLKKASLTQSPILLLGETGTGKEVFARAAHALSLRRSGPFVSVNMAAIRPELFEGELFGHVKGAFTGAVGRAGLLQAAHGGTLFLDEVGELQPDVQAKLLRVLEDGSFYRVGDSRVVTVDVRIVAATNRNLEKDIEAGRYREDLYYRLRSIVLTLPPLRERVPEDRLLLARSFLEMFSGQKGRNPLNMTQGAIDAIVAYRWPGNIRELRQTIAQAVALTDEGVISEASLQLPKSSGRMTAGQGHGQEDWGRSEDIIVLQCLRQHRFDMQATAKDLGWDRSTVTQRLKGMGFQALVEHHQDVHQAARALAGNEDLIRVVEGRLREYAKNLIPPSRHYHSVEEAIADCRKRFRNLPERHFPAVERLIYERLRTSPSS